MLEALQCILDKEGYNHPIKKYVGTFSEKHSFKTRLDPTGRLVTWMTRGQV
jgi:hypothetical protein